MIIYQYKENIGYLTLSSGKGNMLNEEDLKALLDAVRKAVADPNVRGVLVAGSPKCFCTGLQAHEVASEELGAFFSLFDTLLLELFSSPKPVVMAVDGHSIGGGLLLQCCADCVVVANSSNIKIGLPELKIGLTIDELMVTLLKFNTGSVRTIQQLLYSGQYVGADRCQEIGFADCVVDSQDVLSVAQQELAKLIHYNAHAFSITKLRLRSHAIEGMHRALDNNCYEVFKGLK